MDTIEELGGTYFYAGRTNLSASEMLFMVFCEETAHQLGIEDLGAIVAVVSGLNVSKHVANLEGTSKIHHMHLEALARYSEKRSLAM